jgi:hypothetical protein
VSCGQGLLSHAGVIFSRSRRVRSNTSTDSVVVRIVRAATLCKLLCM